MEPPSLSLARRVKTKPIKIKLSKITKLHKKLTNSIRMPLMRVHGISLLLAIIGSIVHGGDQPEVSDLDAAVGSEQNVTRFEIAMDETR